MLNQSEWNQRYHVQGTFPLACHVLTQYQYLLPKRGAALDVACGLGANALLLAKHGLETHAWDYAEAALQKLQQQATQQHLIVHTACQNVEAQPPEANCFDVIVVSHFLERTLFPHLIAALRPHGLLFYQTFTQTKVSDTGPQRAEFRLADNELLQLCSKLHIIAYQELGTIGDVQKGLRNEACLVGLKL